MSFPQARNYDLARPYLRGVKVQSVQILRSGQRRGITRTMKAMIKQRH